jgi:Pyruvate/2-oxoacid:ferredoxin oxidoreductase delta subunit
MIRKYTAADRPEFRRAMVETAERLGMEPGEITQDKIVVCTRATEFDPESNVLWEDEANKSFVRHDVTCSDCKHVMAMSNHTYGTWLAMDKKPRVMCIQCMLVMVEEAKPNEDEKASE